MLHHSLAIVGGGLAGLTLARVLHVHGIAAVVYDLDASANASAQGGMLDIHEESGQAALRSAKLFDEFVAIIHAGGDAMRILDKHGVVRLQDHGDGARPEVNRGALRNLLADSLPKNTIRWSSKVAKAKTLVDGRHEVTFADGSAFTADVLIGADGAWSKVRALVSDATPKYEGVSFVELHLLDAATRHPNAARLVGEGVMFALGDEKGIICHRDSDGRLHGFVAIKTERDWSRDEIFGNADRAKAMLLARFDGWSDELRAMISNADGPLVPRAIHTLPVGHRWPRVRGVTLAGDAAHLMSPFAGEGANLAMQDGAELALAIASHPQDLESALATYELAMFPRSEAAARVSAENLVIALRDDAPQGLLDLMARYRS